MKDFEFTFQCEGQEPLKLNTCQLEEDVLRMKLGLDPHSDSSQYVAEMNNERTY